MLRERSINGAGDNATNPSRRMTTGGPSVTLWQKSLSTRKSSVKRLLSNKSLSKYLTSRVRLLDSFAPSGGGKGRADLLRTLNRKAVICEHLL